jgi:hypothetical protein
MNIRATTHRLLSAATASLVFVCFALSASAQQVNPNKLRPCPTPNFSKSTDWERVASWSNCWGRYRFELSGKTKGDVIESEWRDGKANGYGSYVFFSGEKYIGDFKSDKFDGNGTYIFTDGSEYSGGFKEDKRHGKGKFLALVGDSYEGEYLNDKEHGRGTYTFADGSKYIGDFFEGKKHGQGTLIFQDGEKYSGAFENGYFSGRGTYNHMNGDKYVGEYRNGNKHGQGIFAFANGTKYVGQWSVGIIQGWGTLFHTNGDKYTGEFKDGRYHGRGLYLSSDGRRNEGIFENGNFIRTEKIDISNLADDLTFSINRFNASQQTNPNNLPLCPTDSKKRWHNCWGTFSKDGLQYVGEYREDKIHGVGTFTGDNGKKRYSGEWKFGKMHGLGIYTSASGYKYIGQWREGKKHGKGISTASNGKRQEGIFENGEFIREEKVDLPKLDNNFAKNTDQADIESERQKLNEERRRLDQERREREGQQKNQRVNLQVAHTQPADDGSLTISVKTNADTVSLKVNGEEQGGRADGNYLIKKFARVGQDTQFTIVAVDINGNSETKTISVSRQSVVATQAVTAALKPENIKRTQARDAVAIIIGIQDYKRVPRADFANNDAKEFYEYAVRALGVKPEKIKMLLDDEADEINMVKAFENWLPIQVNRDKTDVYVFFSGHGLPAPDGKSLYFLPHGVDKELLSRTAVAQNEVIAALSAAKPRSVTMFIDACYSGQTRAGDVLVANAKPVALKSDASVYPANFTVITASANDQISSSSPDLKHGIFSFYLMKGMEGEADANKDGKITVGEMQDYLSDKVARQAMTLNRKQTTQLVGDSNRVLVAR